ncbi:MAG: PQQ-binding-like beta-propeller repeat protein [Rubripirellula sp.]
MFVRRFLLSILAFLISFAPSAGTAADAEWTGWLGPNRDGWVADYTPPAKWPAELHRLWQVEVGDGYGSPLVHQGRVFLHTRQGDNEVVRCLDLDSGKEIWRQDNAVSFKIGGGGERHGKGPKSCPVLADGRLFTLSIVGTLRAWDASSGKRLWSRDFREHFPVTQPYWGVSTSPIVAQDRVIIHVGNDEKGLLLALDTATGQEVWRQGNDGTSYSSPLIASFGDVTQVVEWNHRALVGVDLETGKLLWEVSFPHEGNNQNMPTPTVHGAQILVGGENRGIHSFQPSRSADGIWSVQDQWHQPKLALDMSTAVINDGMLYGFSHYNSGQLFCLDPISGAIVWQGPGRAGQNAMFLAVPGYVLALMDRGELKVLAANGANTKIVKTYRVAETPTWAPPVLLQNGLLIKDREKLCRWSFDTP